MTTTQKSGGIAVNERVSGNIIPTSNSSKGSKAKNINSERLDRANVPFQSIVDGDPLGLDIPHL